MAKALKLKGRKFGKLRVLERAENGNNGKTRWLCKCKCGNEKIVHAEGLTRGTTVSCGCYGKTKDWAGHGGICLSFWHSIRDGAKRRKLEFTVTIEEAWDLFQRQQSRCAITGEPLIFAKMGEYRSHRGSQTASLDRIDSSKGYIPGNIQWVHRIINEMKWDYPQEEFVTWCKRVVEHNAIRS